MYAIYGNIYHQYTPNVRIYAKHGSYGYYIAEGGIFSQLVCFAERGKWILGDAVH